jgi:predicted DsbA family dithiol-disulfide isomerase
MSENEKKTEVFEVVCPCCFSILWLDGVTREVVKFEKHAARKKETLDELLEKEKKRKDEFERKFEATAELERQKKEKAKAAFEKALGHVGKED